MSQTNLKKPVSNPTIAQSEGLLAPTYSRPNALFVDGSGSFLIDSEGIKYLDMTSGIGVSCLGHCSPIIKEAMIEALEKPLHISNLFHSAPAALLAKLLTENSFADRVFFANSGAEAVEAAIKFARLGAGANRHRIVYFDGSFHGRTLGALAATDRPDHKTPFEPLPQGFIRAPWNDPRALNHIDEQCAAVILEPIQGEKGVRTADDSWVKSIRARCDSTGTLLIFDEIQCGMGRTGHLFAHQPIGVLPDIMTIAKPLAGGLPIGAVLMTDDVSKAISPGLHGTTFGGGPFVTAVAKRVFEYVSDDKFLKTVQDKGRLLRLGLEKLLSSSIVSEIRGKGLMLGIRLQDIEPKVVVEEAFRRQLLVVPSADNVVRILPPLTISNDDIELCVERMNIVLKNVERNLQK